MYEKDTIVSISTGIGEGAIGIVRMSGPDAKGLTRDIIVYSGEKRGLESFRLRHGYVVDPTSGEKVDEVLVSFMRAPRTYTREDIVEINCHGGYIAQGKVVEILIGLGARPAEPGEFTRRAFMNGRIDLLEAEAVLAMVKSRSEEALKAAARQCSGLASAVIGKLREDIINTLSALEASLDFQEEDLEVQEKGAITGELVQIQLRLDELLRREQAGNLLSNGVEVVIVGKPNVGKSSLLNAILQEEKALVAEVPGTTRDAVEGRVTLSGIPFLLVDTAGIHRTGDEVEVLGVERSKIKLKNAQIALVVIDAGGKLEEQDHHILELTAGKRRIIIGNKADLPLHQPLKDEIPEEGCFVYTSTRTLEGIKRLEEEIVRMATGDAALSSGDALIMNMRQRNYLKRAYQGIGEAIGMLESGKGEEIVALALREALDDMDIITGRQYQEDVLDAIFSRFCVGK
jgi:tRNA modification GTPase